MKFFHSFRLICCSLCSLPVPETVVLPCASCFASPTLPKLCQFAPLFACSGNRCSSGCASLRRLPFSENEIGMAIKPPLHYIKRPKKKLSLKSITKIRFYFLIFQLICLIFFFPLLWLFSLPVWSNGSSYRFNGVSSFKVPSKCASLRLARASGTQLIRYTLSSILIFYVIGDCKRSFLKNFALSLLKKFLCYIRMLNVKRRRKSF